MSRKQAHVSDSDIGAIIWPLLKLFLESGETLESVAEKAKLKPRAVQRAFLRPHDQTMGIYGAIGFVLGRDLGISIRPRSKP